MGATNHLISLVLSVVLIVGAYQFYFWCQRNAIFEPRELGSAIDDLIPFVPGWVWIYSFLYYPAILYVDLVLESPGEFTRVATSYLMLLALQMMFFLLFPVRTPRHWRRGPDGRSMSERFLAFVQRFDAPTNSFPSMHTSVAMLTALHLHHHLGAAAFAFPVLIGLSCLFTKQHYVVDIPAGAALGWLDHSLYLKVIAA
jgi:membrane-associated phospholipid phosphatase